MSERQIRQQALYDALEKRIPVLDGAMGSILHKHLTIADYGGPHLENCTDNVVRTRPDLILQIHRQYLEAGADIIETDSFNANRASLSEFQIEDAVAEINIKSAQLAR
jgi:5-methyltetrahydrofolate--homocysteine methyltransferase